MAKFLLKAGTHTERGKLYDAGRGKVPVVVHSGDDLVAEHGDNKFARMPDAEYRDTSNPAPAVPIVAGANDDGQKPTPVSQSIPEPSQTFGEDETGRFPEAGKKKYRVFRKGRVYTVTKENDPATAVNEDDLTSVSAVEEFLAAKRTARG